MIEIRELAILDYDAVMTLWRETPGVGLSAADNREAIAAYLLRNPGLSFAAWDGPRLVGAVLCGHDGRRGYLHHLAVAPAYRRQHLGFELAERCLHCLRRCGIEKCHLFVYRNNLDAQLFWKSSGWAERPDLTLMSSITSPECGPSS